MTSMKDWANDPKIAEFMKDPRMLKLQEELKALQKELYKKLDSTVSTGDSCGGLIKVHYSYGKGGFFSVEVDDSVYKDKEFTLDCVVSAINTAVAKYNIEQKAVEAELIRRETELYNELITIATEFLAAKTKEAASIETMPSLMPKKKKEYLN